MPSPLGHALGALAVGWMVAPPQPDQGRRSTGLAARVLGTGALAALLVSVALLPDLDLLLGTHSQWTHSIGAVLGVFAIALLAGRGRHPRLALALAMAYATHPLLDWLGQDGTAPMGVMAAWPFSDRYFHSGADLFTGISRRYWLPGFVGHNLAAITREVLLLAPLTLAAWWARERAEGRKVQRRTQNR